MQTINALLELKKVTPEILLDEAGGCSPTGRTYDIHDISTKVVLERGQNFFNRIYGKISRRIMGQMDNSGTEDLGLLARLTYSYVLSNTQVLSAVETSYVLIAGLIPQDVSLAREERPFMETNKTQVNPQLKGHLRGAINVGATAEEVRAVRSVVIEICEASGMKILDESVPAGWGWRTEVATI